MPRTKGSKNKPKTVTADFATQIAEKQSAKEALTAEIASITANIDTLKADLKEKKTALKKAEKEVASLEAKKVKADAKAAEEAKKRCVIHRGYYSGDGAIWYGEKCRRFRRVCGYRHQKRRFSAYFRAGTALCQASFGSSGGRRYCQSKGAGRGRKTRAGVAHDEILGGK